MTESPSPTIKPQKALHAVHLQRFTSDLCIALRTVCISQPSQLSRFVMNPTQTPGVVCQMILAKKTMHALLVVFTRKSPSWQNV